MNCLWDLRTHAEDFLSLSQSPYHTNRHSSRVTHVSSTTRSDCALIQDQSSTDCVEWTTQSSIFSFFHFLFFHFFSFLWDRHRAQRCECHKLAVFWWVGGWVGGWWWWWWGGGVVLRADHVLPFWSRTILRAVLKEQPCAVLPRFASHVEQQDRGARMPR